MNPARGTVGCGWFYCYYTSRLVSGILVSFVGSLTPNTLPVIKPKKYIFPRASLNSLNMFSAYH